MKAAAARRGIAEAELLRDAIHLVAMANRSWDETFFSHTHKPTSADDAATALNDTWAEKAEAYERTKARPR